MGVVRVGSLLLLLAAAASAGGIPVTAKGAIAGWPKLPEREFSSDLKLAVAAVVPDGEEGPSLCILGPVRRLGYARPGVKIPPCWCWHVEIADLDAGDDFVAALAAEIRAKGIPGASLNYASRITDVGVAHLRGVPGLRFLGLGGTSVGDAGLAHLLEIPDLVALDLSRCRNVTDAGLKTIARMPRLVALNLDGCMGLTASGLAQLRALPELRWLGLRMTRADDSTAALLSGLKKLEALEVGETLVGDKGVRELKKLKALRGLGLASTQAGDAALAELKGLPALEALDLDLSRATARALPSLAGMKRLSWLSLSGLPIGDDDLAGWRGGSALVELDLTDTKAGDRALAAVAKHGNLRRLQVKGEAITDRGLESLARLQGLEALYLHYCSRVTDAGIAFLGGKPLRSLGLRGNVRLSDAALGTVSTFRDLEWLDLGGCEAIGDEGVARLASLAKLRNLDLGGCRRVTAKAIGDLRAALPGLTSLRGPEETFGPPTPARPVPR